MPDKSSEVVGPTGEIGSYGPNDRGYMVNAVRLAAERLKWASDIFCEGHYAHSNARDMPSDHPIAKALSELAKFDRDNCEYNNVEHDPKLFQPHKPTDEAKHRWDGTEGQEGKPHENRN